MKSLIKYLVLSVIMLPSLAFSQSADATQALQRADEYFRQGQYREAGEIYLELYGDTGEDLYGQRFDATKKIQQLLKKAEEDQKWGDANGALAGYKEVLTLNPDDAAVKAKVEELQAKLGQPLAQTPETRPPTPETQTLKPETRNPTPNPSSPQTRNPKPETRNPKPETPSPQTRTPNPEPRTPKPETRNPKPTIGGHQYVDLGLPSGLKWATNNIGAKSAADRGDYYSWGETATKSRYEYAKAKMNGTRVQDISGMRQYDAARAKWGSSWRIPTGEEVKELIENCTWTAAKEGGKTVLKGTGKNGNVIIFPATGFWEDGDFNHTGDSGYCWCSTNWNYSDSAGALTYRVDGQPVYINFDFYFGMPIRPVTE